MTQIQAIYRDGVFQPLEPVHLGEQQRVRLSIEPVAPESPEAWLEQVRELQGRVVRRTGILLDSSGDIAADRHR